MSITLTQKTAKIKQAAYALGFDTCGIAKADYVGEITENRFQEWLESNHHAEMSYMANHFEKRCNPTLLVENARSVIVLSMNYFPETKQDTDLPQIAYYAYGNDYHDVIREKLQQLFTYIHTEITPITGRCFVDTAPVLERYWAQQAGLGWIGKNNLLIIPGKGSYFFLSELIIDLGLEYDQPMESRCGECSRCITACPTDALLPYKLDARKCLSYLTIEKKGEFTDQEAEDLHNRLFGCDLCQTICPWNRFAKLNTTPEFAPNETILKLSKDDWANLDENSFRSLLHDSPIKRAKFSGIKRNLDRI